MPRRRAAAARYSDCPALMTIYRSNTMDTTSIGHKPQSTSAALHHSTKPYLRRRQQSVPVEPLRVFAAVVARGNWTFRRRVVARRRRHRGHGRGPGRPGDKHAEDRRHNTPLLLITFSPFSLIVTDMSAGFCSLRPCVAQSSPEKANPDVWLHCS